jgi:RNA polymerase sigma factor (sigma-70 family)
MSSYYSKNIDLRFIMLTREQETELFVKARSGDNEARDFLIRNHLLFAARLSRRMVRGKLPDDDVVSAGNFAVMKAFEKFDHTLGHRFTSYLKPFIKGEISLLWKNLSTVRIPPGAVEASSLEAPPVPRVTPDSTEPHEVVEQEEHIQHLLKLLEECQDCLNDHEREILRRVYVEGLSFAAVGRLNGVTREAIRASHNRALVKLQKAFKKRGIEGTE